MEVIDEKLKIPVESYRPDEGENTWTKKTENDQKAAPPPRNVKKEKVTRDRPIKSIFKAITWRLIASATTFVLAYMFFYSDPFAAEKATGIALAEAAIKMVLYFFHERAWERLRWGRMMVIIRRNTRRSRKSIQRIILRKS
ncbi:MAG: DUF2061 domain-containing protein [Bacteroidales bacterium]|nr:DUF2061 domain-containing protein [Bacteroidales bacterium]